MSNMFTLFFRHKNYMIAILILLLLSIICQIVMGVIYHKLIWETENMSTTTNRNLQKLKLKFSSCRQLHETVPNVPVFVDKFINQIKVGRLPLSFLKHVSGQFTLLAVLVAGIGACMGIIHNENFFQIAPFYLISFLGLYCYFAVSSLVDIPGKIKILRTNLIDYLENHLSSRLEQTKLDMRIIQPESSAEDEPDKKSVNFADISLPKHTEKDMENSPAFTSSEAEELELLLKEFLT